MACSVEKTPLKPYCSSFLNYVNSTSLDIALKVSSSERRRVVLLMESVQISPCGFFANTNKADISKFRVENTAILRLRPRKLIFLLFAKMKGFLREQLTPDYLST